MNKIPKATWLNLATIAGVIIILAILSVVLGKYPMKIFNLCGIYVILALSMNLINGFTGLFSLGHAGFMAIGAYTSVLLTMPENVKAINFFLVPIHPLLAKGIALPPALEFLQFPLALIIGGLVAAFVSFIIGAPILRLKDDYLAIATLGLGEIIRVIFTNLQSITNGSLGLKSIERLTNIWWSWGIALFTLIFMIFLIKSSYGRAFKAIREDEIAAESMGINLFKHKVMSFVIGSFFAGVGGGLLAHLIGTIDPMMFRFVTTFNIILIVVLGGIGSISGSVISAVVVTMMMEALRFLDQAMNLGFFITEGLPGLRMVVFSILLMIVILFYPKGLMGRNEITWEKILSGHYFRKLNSGRKRGV